MIYNAAIIDPQKYICINGDDMLPDMYKNFSYSPSKAAKFRVKEFL